LLFLALINTSLFFFFFFTVDDVLDNSCRKIEEAIFHLDDPLQGGAQSATAEYALVQAEKFASTSK